MKFPLKAFSLIELLCVMAVVMIMMVLAAAISGTSDSQKLRSSGDLISGMATQARQYSLGKNTLTAMVVLAAGAPEDRALRTVGLFALKDGHWERISPWRQFQQGIVAEPGESTFLTGAAQLPSPPLPGSLNVSGENVSSFGYQVFLPNGRVLKGGSATLKLVPGFLRGGEVIVKNKADYLTVTFIASTGQTKIYQP